MTITLATQSGLIERICRILLLVVQWCEGLGLRSPLQHLALFLVASYQRHISPHKGFNCAHRTLTGELSCSEYFRQTLQQNGLSQALTELPSRLFMCKQSSRILYRQRYFAIAPDPEKSQPNPPDLEKTPINTPDLEKKPNTPDLEKKSSTSNPEQTPINTPNLKKKPKRQQNTNQFCVELLDCGCLSYDNVSCLSGSDSSPADSTIFDDGLDLSDSSPADSNLSDCDLSDCGDTDGCGF